MIRRQPSVFLLVFIVTGILLADHLGLGSGQLLLCAVLSLGLAGVAWLSRRFTVVCLLLATAVGCVAGSRFSADVVDLGPRDIGHIVDSGFRGTIYGQVDDWPDLRIDRTELLIAVDSVTGEYAVAVEGRILLKIADTTTGLQRGDRVIFASRLYPLPAGTPGLFDYGRYLSLKGVRGIAYLPTALSLRVQARRRHGYFGLIDDLRAAIVSSLQRNLGPETSALACGFLIGETRGIPPDIYERFRSSGTLHLLAVSGSNVALVLLCVAGLLRPLGLSRPRRTLVLLAVILIFAGLCYGDPSVVRASVMAALILLARWIGRIYDLNNIIALTAVIILLCDPAQIFDIGFQLSFMTAWGLILIVPKCTELLIAYHDYWWYRWGVFPLIIAVVAQLVSAPVIAYHFGLLPLLSVPANLVIVPLVSLAVVALIILLIADLILPLLGLFAGSLIELWLRGILGLLALFGGESVPVTAFSELSRSDWGLPGIVFFYGLSWLAVAAFRSKWARRSLVLGTAMGVTLILGVIAVRSTREAKPEVRLGRVPGGVAAVIGQPDAATVDLVLTGLRATPYTLDDRVLMPLVRSAGAADCRNLFVLGCQYGALDDLYRTADQLAVERLFLPSGLQASWHDVAARKEGMRPAVFYGAQVTDSSVAGYTLSDGGLVFRWGDSRIEFVDRFRPEHFRDSVTPPGGTLVIGADWQAATEDVRQLLRLGYGRLVCAKIIQPTAGEYFDRSLDPDQLPCDQIHDLSRDGGLVVRPGKPMSR